MSETTTGTQDAKRHWKDMSWDKIEPRAKGSSDPLVFLLHKEAARARAAEVELREALQNVVASQNALFMCEVTDCDICPEAARQALMMAWDLLEKKSNPYG